MFYLVEIFSASTPGDSIWNNPERTTLIQKFKVHLNNNDTVKEQGKRWTKPIFTEKRKI